MRIMEQLFIEFCLHSLQLENCARPAIITKDLSMIIYGRDARTGPRSLKHLFSGQYRNPEANRLSGVYELSLRRASEAGSPGRTVLVCRDERLYRFFTQCYPFFCCYQEFMLRIVCVVLPFHDFFVMQIFRYCFLYLKHLLLFALHLL